VNRKGYAYAGDSKGIIIHNSIGSVRLFNLPHETAVGNHISFIDPDSPFDRVLQTGKAEMGVMVIIRGRKCLTSIIPIKDGDKVIGALGMLLFRNLSNLKKIIASLNDSDNNEFKNIYDTVARVDSNYIFDDYIGQSPLIREMINQCRRAARTSYPVLIIGETGTGKEILASAFHSENLVNKFTPFVKINCTAIPHDLMESELFGYEKGAFTGAVTSKKGKFELADGGSILLDEIGDMDIRLQGKLLRVLEEKEYERVGGTKLLPLNARIIASTNHDLRELCKEGKFRSDLYYRLSAIEIQVPPLRVHNEDIPLLVEHFIEKDDLELVIPDDVMDLFMQYDWPGNVRELRNIVYRLSIKDPDKPLNVQDVKRILIGNQAKWEETSNKSDIIEIREALSHERPFEAEEKALLIKALENNNYNLSKTAKQLKVARTTLYYKLRKHNITFFKTVQKT
jgi:transcriptional regulator with PAS, ATPase and Fis domain